MGIEAVMPFAKPSIKLAAASESLSALSSIVSATVSAASMAEGMSESRLSEMPSARAVTISEAPSVMMSALERIASAIDVQSCAAEPARFGAADTSPDISVPIISSAFSVTIGIAVSAKELNVLSSADTMEFAPSITDGSICSTVSGMRGRRFSVSSVIPVAIVGSTAIILGARLSETVTTLSTTSFNSLSKSCVGSDIPVSRFCHAAFAAEMEP